MTILVEPPAQPMHKPCQGGCGRAVRLDTGHRLEFGEVKRLLCDWCCPNCFGGEGKGPEQT